MIDKTEPPSDEIEPPSDETEPPSIDGLCANLLGRRNFTKTQKTNFRALIKKLERQFLWRQILFVIMLFATLILVVSIIGNSGGSSQFKFIFFSAALASFIKLHQMWTRPVKLTAEDCEETLDGIVVYPDDLNEFNVLFKKHRLLILADKTFVSMVVTVSAVKACLHLYK